MLQASIITHLSHTTRAWPPPNQHRQHSNTENGWRTFDNTFGTVSLMKLKWFPPQKHYGVIGQDHVGSLTCGGRPITILCNLHLLLVMDGALLMVSSPWTGTVLRTSQLSRRECFFWPKDASVKLAAQQGAVGVKGKGKIIQRAVHAYIAQTYQQAVIMRNRHSRTLQNLRWKRMKCREMKISMMK